MEYSLSGGGVDEYSLLTVQSLWDSAGFRHNIFAQGSVAKKEDRYTANVGLGYRYITPDMHHMFGANAFFDHQWPYNHNRMSIGLDYKNSLYGASVNHYIHLSDWRGRSDGFEEKALGGTDLELSGRLSQAPELEVFAKGFHWNQKKTAVYNPKNKDIWGYEIAAEYTPVNILTFRSSATKDNEMDNFEGAVTMRLNYKFGQGFDDLFKHPSYNLNSVVERRFSKVRRQNDIRVQVHQDSNLIIDVVTVMLGLNSCPSGNLSAPANSGCARLFGPDPTDTNDVMVYAGDVPGLTTDFFVRRCDLGMTWTGAACTGARSNLQWKDSNTDSATINIGTGTPWDNDNARNGPNNTALLVADGSGIHAAAEACDNLSGGGWYLPGISEVDVMYARLIGTDDPEHPLPTVNPVNDSTNSGTIGILRTSFVTNGRWYWSSSEINVANPWVQRFSDGNEGTESKTGTRPIRCARR